MTSSMEELLQKMESRVGEIAAEFLSDDENIRKQVLDRIYVYFTNRLGVDAYGWPRADFQTEHGKRIEDVLRRMLKEPPITHVVETSVAKWTETAREDMEAAIISGCKKFVEIELESAVRQCLDKLVQDMVTTAWERSRKGDTNVKK